MNAEYIKDFLSTIVFLTPVLVLVWKGAQLSTRFEQLETEVKDKTRKFCEDHAKMREEIEEEQEARRNDNEELKKTLGEIRESVVRIEVKMGVEEK
jgi:hypothetical protein